MVLLGNPSSVQIYGPESGYHTDQAGGDQKTEGAHDRPPAATREVSSETAGLL